MVEDCAVLGSAARATHLSAAAPGPQALRCFSRSTAPIAAACCRSRTRSAALSCWPPPAALAVEADLPSLRGELAAEWSAGRVAAATLGSGLRGCCCPGGAAAARPSAAALPPARPPPPPGAGCAFLEGRCISCCALFYLRRRIAGPEGEKGGRPENNTEAC